MWRTCRLAGALVLLGACSTAQRPAIAPQGEGTAAPIVDGAGKPIGTVSTRQDAAGVALRVAVEGLSPGQHGMHLHEVGKCEGPKFQSAGAHWNWTGKQHGHENPAGHHAGDLGNLTVGADGKGSRELVVGKADWNSQLDKGLALVIHAAVDDERTDPSGNSGDRIACGVLFPAPAAAQ